MVCLGSPMAHRAIPYNLLCATGHGKKWVGYFLNDPLVYSTILLLPAPE